VVPARAKLNLDLEVLGRRDDGFHEVHTTYQAIDLHDLLEVTPTPDVATTLTVSGLDLSGTDENAVLKAHRCLQAAAGRELPTRFHLHKRIPPGSGLGGASSDAAAALRALSRLHRLELDLESTAAQVGADVPFFVRGGTAAAAGRGDRLTPLAFRGAWFAIAWPGIRLSTAEVYRAWDEVGGEPPNALLRAAERVEPRLARFARTLAGTSERGDWQLTGSGSAFFRRCATRSEAEALTRRLDCWTAVSCAVEAWL